MKLEGLDLSTLSYEKQTKIERLLEVIREVAVEEEVYIKKPEDVFRAATDLINLPNEHLICLFLNSKNKVISRKTIFIGSLNASIAHPREIFREAIIHNCASLICVHNHPSGDPTPSSQDVEISRRLAEAGEIIGIDVLDHVIIGKYGYCSIKEMGLM